MRWFRFYDDTLNNPKVQRLSGELYKAWGNLLCVASKHSGTLPPIEDVAFALRTSEQKAQAWLEALIGAELFDRDSDGNVTPHDWAEWQRESDSAAERMRRHRQRKRDGYSDVTVTSHVRNSDGAEVDTEQNREEKKESTERAGASAMPRNWQPDASILQFSALKCILPDELAEQAEMFRDHYLANGHLAADWNARFRLWLNRRGQFYRPSKVNGKSRNDAIRQALDDFNAWCDRGNETRDPAHHQRGHGGLPKPAERGID